MNTAQEFAADIARELREKPEAWLQGRFSNGKFGNSTDRDATAWCLSGHLIKRNCVLFYRVYSQFASAANIRCISVWNDSPGRTVEEVIALCDRVATHGREA